MADNLIHTQSLDSFDTSFKVYHHDSIIQSKAYSKFLKGTADDIENGSIVFGEPWFKIECSVIYITSDDVIVGYMVYSTKGLDVLHLFKLHTDPNYTHRDVYKMLFTAICNIAKEKQFLSISTTIPVENLPALEAAHDVGLITLFKQLYKKI